MKDLGTLGGAVSGGTDLNAAGQVTGRASTLLGKVHAFLYSSGHMKDLGTLGGRFSSGEAINNAGQVTGWAYIAGGIPHAFLYNGGVMKDLGTLGRGGQSFGVAINASGQVTGHSDVGGPSPSIHAFRYSGGVMKDLGTLGGSSMGLAINNAGQVVGRSASAFVYIPGTGMIDLNTVIPSGSGWTWLQSGCHQQSRPNCWIRSDQRRDPCISANTRVAVKGVASSSH